MSYLLQILKGLRNRKSLSLINIFGLSVCIAAALLIFIYIRFELSYDSFHQGENVYRVESRLYEGNTLTDNWATTTFGHGPVMSREIPGIEKYVRVTAQDREQVVKYEDIQFAEDQYCYTEPAFFEIFNFPILKGEKNGQLTRPNTVVITESAAHRYFNKADPLGKILTFRTASAEQNFEVTGVIADMPANSHLHYDFLLSYNTIPQARQDIWYIHGVYTYVRLEPGKNPNDLTDAFRNISDQYRTTALQHKKWAVELIPLKDIHLTPQKSYEKENKGSRTAVYILTVMLIALLLIGWVNALNLTVARFLDRGKEFGVRKAFGASYGQTFLQGLSEAGLLNILAMFLAIGWVEVLLPLVYSLAGQDFGSTIIRQAGFWQTVIALIVTGTLFTGLYPSFLLTRIRPSDIMRGKIIHSKKGNTIRKSLIIVQFIASFVLITGTVVVIRQIQYMQSETTSASAEQVTVVKYPSFTDDMSVRMESFKKQLRQRSYVRQVTVSGAVPGVEVANYFTNRPYGSALSEVKLIQMFSVDYDYMNTYTPEFICGRGFSEDYGDELNKIILNEEAVNLLGYTSGEAALGQQISMEVLSEPLEIIGVIKNYHQQSMATPYKPIIFFQKERVPFIATPYISILTDNKIGAQQITEIERIYQSLFPTSLFTYYFLDDFNAKQYREDRNFGWIFASAALLAVFVACLGLWVVTLFSTLSRTREIVIRKVLGAGKIKLFMALTHELMMLTILATLLGIPISVFLMKSWLNSYAFHISLNWWIYVLAFILLLIIAFLTVIRQVWRTIHLQPMEILRNE